MAAHPNNYEWKSKMKFKKECSVKGCTRPQVARGYCRAEYNRMRKTGKLQTLANTRTTNDMLTTGTMSADKITMKSMELPHMTAGDPLPAILIRPDEPTWVIWAIAGLIAAGVAVIVIGRLL